MTGYLCMFFLHSSVCSQVLCVDKCCVLTSAESESLVLSVYGVATVNTVRSSLPCKFVLAIPRSRELSGGCCEGVRAGSSLLLRPELAPPEWPSL